MRGSGVGRGRVLRKWYDMYRTIAMCENCDTVWVLHMKDVHCQCYSLRFFFLIAYLDNVHH